VAAPHKQRGRDRRDYRGIPGGGRFVLPGEHPARHHRAIIQAVRRWGQWIVPVVFILIGFYIFHKTGALS
jgi:hypothetical protein